MSTRSVLITIVVLAARAVAQAQTPAGTAFTYQGQLKLNGTPVNGQAAMQFLLFDAEAGGTQVGYHYEFVSVEAGLFTTRLDFGASVFNGDARWLEVMVQYPADISEYVTLSPRQELTPAPYALYSNAPWAAATNGITYSGGGVSIDKTLESGWALDVAGPIRGISASGVGVEGDTVGDATGVYGRAHAEAAGTAVVGETYGTGKAGFFKINNSNNIETALYATTNGSGAGVEGHSEIGTGVIGNSPTGQGVAGFCDSGSGVAGTTNNGSGVIGVNMGSGNGVAGIHHGPDGSGVYGISDHGWAGFFDGDLHVSGNYEWVATKNFHLAGSGDFTFDFDDADGEDLWAVWNGGPVLTVRNSGTVGIGTWPSSGASLDVAGGIRARGGPPGPTGTSNNGYAFGDPGDNDSGMFSSADGQIEFYTNATETMRLAWGGNLGIGLPDPSERLDVNGTARLRGMGDGTGYSVVADADGKLWKQSSSLRHKANVADLDSQGDAVLGLRPKTFDWKTSGQSDIGLIAEEVAAVLPDLVICNAAGEPDGVKYDKVAVYLIDVVKSQRAQIAEQQNDLAAQQKELADLRARLAKIEEALGGQIAPQTGGER